MDRGENVDEGSGLRVEHLATVVRGVRLLFGGETMCMAGRYSDVLGLMFPNWAINEERVRLAGLLDEWIDRLVAERLMSGLRAEAGTQPPGLFQKGDRDRVLDMMRGAGVLAAELEPRAELLGSIVEQELNELHLGLLVVGAADEHAGFWYTTETLVRVGLEQEVTSVNGHLHPDFAVETTQFRNAVFALIMTAAQWRLYADFIANTYAGKHDGIGLSDLVGNIDEVRAHMTDLTGRYFAEREREIWPNG